MTPAKKAALLALADRIERGELTEEQAASEIRMITSPGKSGRKKARPASNSVFRIPKRLPGPTPRAYEVADTYDGFLARGYSRTKAMRETLKSIPDIQETTVDSYVTEVRKWRRDKERLLSQAQAEYLRTLDRCRIGPLKAIAEMADEYTNPSRVAERVMREAHENITQTAAHYGQKVINTAEDYTE